MLFVFQVFYWKYIENYSFFCQPRTTIPALKYPPFIQHLGLGQIPNKWMVFSGRGAKLIEALESPPVNSAGSIYINHYRVHYEPIFGRVVRKFVVCFVQYYVEGKEWINL